MSEQTLNDPMAAGKFAPTVAPGISLPEVGKNKWVRGIIVPSKVEENLAPYRVTQQTAFPSGDLLFFREKDGSQGKPRTQLVFVVGETGFTEWAGTSDNFRERIEEAEADEDLDVPSDVGLRRVTIKSGKPLNAFKDVLKAVGVKNFEIGGTIGLRWTGKEKAQPGSDAQPYIMEYEYAPPTEETRKRAQELYEEHFAKPQDNDPMGDDEPPV